MTCSLHENAILIIFGQLKYAGLIILLFRKWYHRLLNEIMLLDDLLFIFWCRIGVQVWLKRHGLLFQMGVLIHILDCRSVGIAFVDSSSFLSFGHIVNVIYHVLGAFKGMNIDLLCIFILFQTLCPKVCELLILTSFKLVCISVGSRVLEIGERRWSRLFIEYREFVCVSLLLWFEKGCLRGPGNHRVQICLTIVVNSNRHTCLWF